MLAVVALGYAALKWRGAGFRFSRTSLAAGVLVFLVAILTVTSSPILKSRVATLGGLFSSDFETVDKASSRRLTLWRTGYAAFSEHWINGVGARGFRYVYNDYAADDDFWIAQHGSGQTHPHLLLMEVAVETGALGLIGLACFYIWIIRSLVNRPIVGGGAMWLLAGVVAWFPLNAHLAFYGSYWTSFVWLMLALGFAHNERQPTSPG